jgi:hypothetical protein
MRYAKEIWLEQIAVGRLHLVALVRMEINYSSTAEFENIIIQINTFCQNNYYHFIN